MTAGLDAVEAAVRSLDLAAVAGRRWYASKDLAPTGAALAHAFTLAGSAVLALVDVSAPGRRDRYTMAFSVAGDGLREADPPDGAPPVRHACSLTLNSVSRLIRPAFSSRNTIASVISLLIEAGCSFSCPALSNSTEPVL